MIKTILAVFTLLVSSHCFADKPQCYGTYGGYCQYNGYVQNLYINSGNVILVYFDTAMDEGEWEKAGVAATQRSAAAILVDENPEFAKMFYSTALSA